MYDRNFKNVEPVTTGLKILKIDVGKIRFLDSLSFFMQPLSSLPASFGFERVVLKGYFPHLFNKVENINYVGPLPDIKYYGADDMKP